MFKIVFFFYFCFQCPRALVHAAYTIKPPKIIHHLVLLLLLVLPLNKAFAYFCYYSYDCIGVGIDRMARAAYIIQQNDTLMLSQTSTERRLLSA